MKMDWTAVCLNFKREVTCEDMEQYLSLHYYIGEFHFDPRSRVELDAAQELALIKATSQHPEPYQSIRSKESWESFLYKRNPNSTAAAPFVYHEYIEYKAEKERGCDGVYLPKSAVPFMLSVVKVANALSPEEQIEHNKFIRWDNSYLRTLYLLSVSTMTSPSHAWVVLPTFTIFFSMFAVLFIKLGN